MKKIIFAQVLTTNGTTEFSGLYDENGNPVVVEMECDDNGVTLTIWRNAPETERRDCVQCMMTVTSVHCGIIAMKMRRFCK